MREGRCEDEEDPNEQEEEATTLGNLVGWYGVLVEADGVVEAKEHDDSHQCLPWKLDDDVGQHEGLP